MRAIPLVGLVLAAAACGSASFVPPPPPPDRVYGMKELDEPPEIVLAPPLKYPERGSDGVVVVRLVLDSAGNPEPSTMIVTRGSDSALVAAARAMVSQTLFRPVRVRGRVVEALDHLPVDLCLETQPPVPLQLAGAVAPI